MAWQPPNPGMQLSSQDQHHYTKSHGCVCTVVLKKLAFSHDGLPRTQEWLEVLQEWHVCSRSAPVHCCKSGAPQPHDLPQRPTRLSRWRSHGPPEQPTWLRLAQRRCRMSTTFDHKAGKVGMGMAV
eukprot:365018-Chlamydomonas_euryale.AAC.17